MQTPDNTDPKYVQLAEQVPDFWLSDLESERFNELLKSSEIQTYQDGEVIIQETAASQPWLFFLLSGQVALLKAGKVQDVLKRRGDPFGETGMIQAPVKQLTAQAVGETRCFAVDAGQVERVAGQDKLAFGCILYRLFAETVADSLQDTDRNLAQAYQELEQLETDLQA